VGRGAENFASAGAEDVIAAGERSDIGRSVEIDSRTRIFLALLFFFSGFCSLLYQIVWLRIAFARFGVITPVLSVVLSVFMSGLGIGSVLGGQVAQRWSRRLKISSAYLYGIAELIIGIGAFVAPLLFRQGEHYLLMTGEASSTGYMALSAIFIVVAILPWCVMMGATFPLMMAFVRQIDPTSRNSFSFLYSANVMGAMVGTSVTALVLVELFGFHGTYVVAAICNFLIAAASLILARLYPYTGDRPTELREPVYAPAAVRSLESKRWLEMVLFTTGFTSLAMEVIWTRASTLVLKTTIYSFAAILTTYLLSTWIGSYIYRRGLLSGLSLSTERLLGVLCIFCLIPVVLNDPRINDNVILTLQSIAPFCLALGYLTPRLIDEYSQGSPAVAGKAYSVNIAGGVLGPLVAAYILLPTIGVRAGLLVLCAPIFLLFAWATSHALVSSWGRIKIVAPTVALLLFSIFVSRSYEDGVLYNGPQETHRDHVASVTAYGVGMSKKLMVNGISITNLTPITKVMAHLPLAVNNHANSGLVICFGMGTTFRAMHSWGINTMAAELAGSVPASFGFFFADSQEITADPKANIIIDDGRRYLVRSNKTFDIITIDPPPPVEAAASSLLYSKEFYEVVKTHLAPNGLLQQWFPGGDDTTLSAVTRSLRQSFPYVVAFKSIEDWGYHFLASMTPIEEITPTQFVERLPESAKRDLMEWNSNITIEKMAENILSRRIDIENLLGHSDAVVTDDRPYNEYFVLRRYGWRIVKAIGDLVPQH
jgi:spermidine synthase